MISSQHAFSLIEMLIAFSIVAILLAISFSSYEHFFTRTNDELLQSQLLHTITLARQEAQARHVPVALCKSHNNLTCSGHWLDGQLIFLNENQDGVPHDKTQILFMQQGHNWPGVLHWRSYPFYRHDILFLPTGWSRNNGTFWYCRAANESPRWAIMLSRSGKTRVVLPNSQGMIKDQHGKLLRCENE